MTTAQACEAIICLVHDAGDDDRLLPGTAKMRSARRDAEVCRSTQELVNLDLPSWTDDDGTQHPPRVQSGVPVLGDSWLPRLKASSAASGLIDWMCESGPEGGANAIPLVGWSNSTAAR